MGMRPWLGLRPTRPEKPAGIRVEPPPSLAVATGTRPAATAAALRDFDLRDAIRAVRARVLVLVGMHDPSTPPALGGLIAEHVAGARLVALDAAHLSNLEAANDFTRAIVSFLTAP